MKDVFFPVFFNISEKNILVIGGGKIATRRVHTLIEFASNILVVAPKISEELELLVKDEKVVWISDEYKKDYLLEKEIVVVATDNINVNHQVKRDCDDLKKQRDKLILVNVADDKNLCDFHFPSIVKKDNVVIGINSGGVSPAQTKEIRKKVEGLLNADSVYEMEN